MNTKLILGKEDSGKSLKVAEIPLDDQTMDAIEELLEEVQKRETEAKPSSPTEFS